MSQLTEIEILELQIKFGERWPEALHAMLDTKNKRYYEATYLWLGFKEGYVLGCEEAREDRA